MCTESAYRTTGQSSCQLANIFQLDYSTSTSFRHYRETPHTRPDEEIAAISGTADNKCHTDCGLTLIARDVLRPIWSSWWVWRFVELGRCRRQTPNQPGANQVFIDAICEKDGAGQLQCIQQVQESMGGRVSGEEELVHYPGAEPFETGLRWTPALGDGCPTFFGDIWELAAVG